MTPESRLILLSDGLNAMDQFRREGELPAPFKPPSISSSAPGNVSLSELLAGVSLEWYEALAIVQSLCRSIIDSGDQIGPASVDFQNVFISADGSVTGTSKGPRQASAAVQCFGKMLERLLPDHDYMFLKARLVSKAISSPPFYNSLQELSNAIAYYERPNRPEIIQSLHRRYSSRPVQPIAAPPKAEVVAATSPVPDEPKRGASRRTLPIRRAMVFVIIAGILLGVAAGTAVWKMRRDPGDAAPEATENLPADTVGVVSPAAGSTGARRSISPVAMASQSVRQAVSPRQVILDSPLPAREDPAGVTRELDSIRFQSAPSLAISPQPVVRLSDARLEEPPAPGTIYTDRDYEVVPPNIEYPHFPNESASGKSALEMFIIEVVVNEQGRVDMAKARRLPRTIGESLFLMNTLSATKSWRFHPALKGIYPVKYRYFFALSQN